MVEHPRRRDDDFIIARPDDAVEVDAESAAGSLYPRDFGLLGDESMMGGVPLDIASVLVRAGVPTPRREPQPSELQVPRDGEEGRARIDPSVGTPGRTV